MALVRAVEGNDVHALDSGWECAAVEAGRVDHPSNLEAAAPGWRPAQVPGTAASSLAAGGHAEARNFDAEDWWFRRRDVPVPAGGARTVIRFGGLATLADVWLDGAPLLHSENMFLGHEVDVTGRLRPGSELVLRCASLEKEIGKRRPRPRWRSHLVSQQQLRWMRTALVGRIPAWPPQLAPVGPYRPVELETQARVRVAAADIAARVDGDDGVCAAGLRVVELDAPVEGITLRVGDARAELACTRASDGTVLAQGTLRLPRVKLWWPFTHGGPHLYPVRAEIRTRGSVVAVDLGRTGFRAMELNRASGGFEARVNGVGVFCRGATWTPLDVVGLQENARATYAALQDVREAGMNMIRIGGTFLYASQELHDACDELGILVWQDFMFACMDYPAADEAFTASARAEASQLLDRLQLSPSLAVACGNSEVHQQAAMVGVRAADRESALFGEVLPACVRAVRPDVPYVESCPSGGALPFHVDVGVSHYFGVGAYRRPLEDARRARVRFAAECLGFANVPCDETIDAFMGGEPPTNHPHWKAVVPRDKGASWDFDDVRDHYVREMFHVDPAELRAVDVARYLQLARVTTGEIMAVAMAEWRRARSECRGALVWMLRDFVPSPGWGLVDARGRRKAAWYILRRAMQPEALLVTDEGLNGLALHVINDGPQPLRGRLRLTLYRQGAIPVAEGETEVAVDPHGNVETSGDALLGHFTDSTYAYRFGPPGHDAVVATLLGATGEAIAQAFHFPTGRSAERLPDVGLSAVGRKAGPGLWRLTVEAKRLAQNVAIEAPGFVADDDFFHVDPRTPHVVHLRGDPSAALSARLLPLNAAIATKVVTESAP
ncbi:MAG TPA: hypothetical protein VF765_03855 [Polyangiaceae bacterium]